MGRANRGVLGRLMFAIGAPGAERAFVPAGVLFAAWSLYARGARAALTMLAATALTLAVNRLCKRLFPRRRPNGALSRAPSFPSGHAMAGVAVYGVAFDIAGRFSWNTQPLIAAIALLLGLSLGLTRVVRRQHWPSDVAAGLMLGVAIFAAAATFMSGFGDHDPGGARRQQQRSAWDAMPPAAPDRLDARVTVVPASI